MSVTLLLTLLIYHSANAVTYYIGANGSDSYSASQAQSPSTPWKTIQKLDSVTLNSGDIVLFRRGDTFRGQVNAKTGVTYDAYGTGNDPVISGAIPVNGWTVYTGNIYKASVNRAVKNLFVNSQQMTLARYPNRGFLKTDKTTNRTSFHVAGLTSSINWAGANIRIATLNYMYETLPIASYNGSTITLAVPLHYDRVDSTVFYVDNKLEALDTEGEWYYDEASGQVYLYAPGGVNPSAQTVEVSVYDYGFRSNPHASNITIQNLRIEKQVLTGIWLIGNTASNNKIRNNKFFSQWLSGVQVMGNNITVNGNYFQDILGRGIEASYISNSFLTSNVLRRIGLIPGYGISGISGSTGIIYTTATQLLTSMNQLDSIGYAGIRGDGKYCTIEKNKVSYPLLTLTDGAGIYSWDSTTHHNVIQKNFVYYPRGFDNGKPGGLAAGIYMDDLVHDNIITGNTIVGSSLKGIILNDGNKNHTVTGNICYGSADAGLRIADWGENYPVQGHVIKKNIFYALHANAVCLEEEDNFRRYNYGTYDSNYYFNPYSDFMLRRDTVRINPLNQQQKVRYRTQYSIAQWRLLTGNDASSRKIPHLLDLCPVTAYLGSNLIGNGSFDTNTNGWYKSSGSTTTISYETGVLDGGALKFTMNSNSVPNVAAISPVFNAAGGQYYEVGFTIRSSRPASVEMIVRKNASPYTKFYSKKFSMDTARRDISHVFQMLVPNSDTRIDFQILYEDKEFWLDNVKIVPVSVQCEDPKDRSRLFENPSDNTLTVNLNTVTYKDLEGNIVTGSISLAPWTSRILVMEDLPVAAITSPANHTKYTTGTNIAIEANATVKGAIIQKVEFYQGQTKIGEDYSSPYSMVWNNPAIGVYAVTAKATDTKGMSNSSAPVTIHVTGVPSRFEAENNYTAVTEAGTNRAISPFNCNNLSNLAGISLFDINDKAQISFNVPSSGVYQLFVQVRSGDAMGPAAYTNGYDFRVDNVAQTFTLNTTGISAASNCLGTSNWGNMESSSLTLTSGTHVLTVEAKRNYAAVDYLEVVKTGDLRQGTEEESQEASANIRLYPNPASNEVTIRFNSSAHETAVVAITDEMGKTMFTEARPVVPGENYININTEHLAEGIYYIKIVSESIRIGEKMSIKE